MFRKHPQHMLCVTPKIHTNNTDQKIFTAKVSNYQNQPVNINLNGITIFTLPADQNINHRIKVKKGITLEEPKIGDIIDVLVANSVILTEKLHRD